MVSNAYNVGDGFMDKSEIKVLISKLSGLPVLAISDNHPEVLELADISSDKLIEKLWKMTNAKKIETFFEVLGLSEDDDFPDELSALSLAISA